MSYTTTQLTLLQSASAIQPDAVGGELQSNQTDSSSQVMEVDDQQSGMESEAPKVVDIHSSFEPI